MMKRNFVVSPLWRSARNPSLVASSGLTIVEVMLSLVLLAITAALSLPSYREMVEKRQLTHGAEQIMAFVNSVQGEASKHNSIVTVSYSRTDDDDWCVGATLGATACDCTETVSTELDYCAIDSVPSVVNNGHAGNTQLVKSFTGDGSFGYDPVRGIFVDLADTFEVEMRSNTEQFRLDLVVSNTGQVTLCSKDSSHSVPGYEVCPADDAS